MIGRAAVLSAVLAGLAGCGVIYTAPSVHDGTVFGATKDTAYDVEIVPLTYETAAAANLTPYVPQRLPSTFQPGAVDQQLRSAARSGSGGARGLTAPPRPTASAERRPGFIADRIPPQAEAGPYRIGVADVLLLSIKSPATQEDLPGLIEAQSKRQGYVVQDDGAIAIPDVGRVQVAGSTLMEAEAAVFQAVAAAGIDPSFTLEIAEFNSQRVTVGGLVRAPQLVPITLKPLTLAEALQIAGGVADVDPDLAAIEIARDGETFQMSVDRLQSEPRLQRIRLTDGDTVFVTSDYREAQADRRFEQELALRNQQLTAVNFQQSQLELAQATLETERQIFRDRLEFGAVPRHHAFVTGEVRDVKRVPLPFEQSMSLADLMFQAGGLDIETGDYGEIYLLRGAAGAAGHGGVTAYHLDAENAVNLVVATAMQVRPDDILFVTEQPVTSWNRTLSQILPNIFLSAANAAAR